MSHATLTLPPEAAALFARFVALRETNPGLEFEGFVAEHPQHARDLRRLHTCWLWVQRLFAGWKTEPAALLSAARALAERELELDEQTSEQLQRLARFRDAAERFLDPRLVSAGGMGLIYRVRDRELDRELAMKVLHVPAAPLPGAAADQEHAPDGRQLRRFLAEARLTARLDHPGIVPVHEVGIDSEQRPFFTMRFVRGSSLSEVLLFAAEGSHGWTRVRVLEILLRVCDAVAYAHSQGVIHRDLKPANIMVGAFGETYVMDWGLARTDEALQDLEQPASRPSGGRAGDITRDGDVLGTPAYMPPEQAASQHDRIGPHTDVYAMGAILYQLLCGSAPYSEDGAARSGDDVLKLLLAGPPRALAELAPLAPPELVAVSAKAMARDIPQRYPDMRTMAEDLRAYLEGRVVPALEHGRGAEARKWILRNKGLSWALASALVAVVLALLLVWRHAEERAERAQLEADLRGPAALTAAAQELFAARPELLPRMQAWIREAEALVARGAGYATELERLRLHARPLADDDPEEAASRQLLAADLARLGMESASHRTLLQGLDPARSPEVHQTLVHELGWLDEELELANRRLHQRQVYRFDDPDQAEVHRNLSGLVEELRAFAGQDPRTGVLESIRLRATLTQRLAEQSLDAAHASWMRAIESIADVRECPRYEGLRIVPQAGLVPLRRNPQGLWEFAHLLSGAAPGANGTAAADLTFADGIVLVLLPGATLEHDSGSWVAQPDGSLRSSPTRSRRRLQLAPLLASKYELTRSQWRRLRELAPGPRTFHDDHSLELRAPLEPVDLVSWHEAEHVLRCADLALPSEAQWVYAAGIDPRHDAAVASTPQTRATLLAVDTLEPNAFGLHHCSGNVSEWTADPCWAGLQWPVSDGDGRLRASGSGLRAVRGGNAAADTGDVRRAVPERNRLALIGLRPVRALAR